MRPAMVRVLFFLYLLDGVLDFRSAARIRILAAGARRGIQCLLEIFERPGMFAAFEQEVRHEIVLVYAVWVDLQRPLEIFACLRSEEHTSELQSQSNLVC